VGYPNEKEAKRAVAALQKQFGWAYEHLTGKGHTVGVLRCAENSREGCTIWVDGTANNTAKYVWSEARKCYHGCAPDRRRW